MLYSDGESEMILNYSLYLERKKDIFFKEKTDGAKKYIAKPFG